MNTHEIQLAKLPRPAATIILVRDSESGLQTYLLRRSSKSKFFPSSFVFPGGALDEDDRDIQFWKDHIDISMEGVERKFGRNGLSGKEVLPFCVAAIRETFEEAGVLFVSSLHASEYEQACDMRLLKELKGSWLKDIVSTSGSRLNLDALSRWSHWITPRLMKYHFDTLFFIAIMQEGQTCTPDMKETDEGTWIGPKEALSANLEGSIPLTPPTIVTMHELLAYPDTTALRDNWETREWGESRLPCMVKSGGDSIILEPWDPVYPDDKMDKNIRVDETMILPALEPFSRLWLHRGIWKPVRGG
jgi:8-oxo-dGTP pyrophosphatase MutT (NUDIX family)